MPLGHSNTLGVPKDASGRERLRMVFFWYFLQLGPGIVAHPDFFPLGAIQTSLDFFRIPPRISPDFWMGTEKLYIWPPFEFKGGATANLVVISCEFIKNGWKFLWLQLIGWL